MSPPQRAGEDDAAEGQRERWAGRHRTRGLRRRRHPADTPREGRLDTQAVSILRDGSAWQPEGEPEEGQTVLLELQATGLMRLLPARDTARSSTVTQDDDVLELALHGRDRGRAAKVLERWPGNGPVNGSMML